MQRACAGLCLKIDSAFVSYCSSGRIAGANWMESHGAATLLDQWELVTDLVQAEPKPSRRPPKDRRTMAGGIFWILRTGASWRDLPERLGKWQWASVDRRAVAGTGT